MHLACLPFPSAQGTQAAIASLLEALLEAGEDAELLTYPFGDARLKPTVEPARPKILSLTRSLRSGPSLAKLFLDMQIALALRRLTPSDAPIIAHHVEAAWAARLAGRGYYYIAHTSVEDELEAYFPRLRGDRSLRTLRSFGALLDRFAVDGAERCAAVSPALAARLKARYGRPFGYLPIPWKLPDLMPRERAREALRISPDAVVILYTGNLDAYQRWELGFEIAGGLSESDGREIVYLIGTESEAGPVHAQARAMGFSGEYRVLGCAHEIERATLHAAADLALIPRRLDGGVPIKLLEALARDRPALVSEEASAGLELGADVAIVRTGRTEDYLLEAERLLARSRTLGEGRAFIARAHSKEAAIDAFRVLIGTAEERAQVERSIPSRPAVSLGGRETHS